MSNLGIARSAQSSHPFGTESEVNLHVHDTEPPPDEAPTVSRIPAASRVPVFTDFGAPSSPIARPHCVDAGPVFCQEYGEDAEQCRLGLGRVVTW